MKWWLVLITGIIYTEASSQEVKMYAWPQGDKTILIWLPDGEKTWLEGIEKGFLLYRTILIDDGKLLTSKEASISKQLIGTYSCTPEDLWMEKLDTTDQWEVLTVGMVYGDFSDMRPDLDYSLGYMVDMNQMSQNRYLFNLIGVSNSTVAMQRMGYLGYDDKLAEGNVYLYEITMGDSDKVLGEVVVQSGLKPESRMIEGLSLENTPGGIFLAWDIMDEYVNYWVQRSSDGNQWFTINESPIMTVEGSRVATFLDYSVVEGEDYHYRVKGKTIFGEWGPYSDGAIIKRKGIVAEGYIFITSFIETENGLSVEWSYEGEAILESLDMLYSESYDGPFIRIAKMDSFNGGILNVSEKLNSGYIHLSGVDEYRRTIKSVKRLYNPVDAKAPGIPQKLRCSVDTVSSLVLLEWDPVLDQDIKGYRVFFSNDSAGHYLDMGQGVTETNRWTLPVKYETNGESLYFKIQSVDHRLNTSELGSTCEVRLPDRKPPASPLIRKVLDDGSSIIVEWAISPGWDVIDHVLERKEEGKDDWSTLIMEDSEDEIRFYRDSMIVKGKSYLYRVGAIDQGGNVSYSKERLGKISGYNYREGIESLRAIKMDNQIVLSWQSVPPALLSRTIIYRAMDDGGYITYKTIGQFELRNVVDYVDGLWRYQYVDNNVFKSHHYRYAVRLVWKDGNTSQRSEEVEIKL